MRAFPPVGSGAGAARPTPRPMSGPARRVLAVAALAALAGCASGVSDLGYYWQSARGQFALMARARPIGQVLADPGLDPGLRSRLERAVEIREFAAQELGLPDNGSYTRYADLGRPYVVWNVFATRELSLELRQWCFPVAGCVGYRGWFDREAAEREAATLRAQGWDAFVAGVPAYSTLGWFDDPVLSTFVRFPEGELARLVFHELAHQVVYVKGDTTFNESFATAVEQAGMRRWLDDRADPAVEREYREFSGRRREFVALLLRHRDLLEGVYRAGGSVEELRARKAAVFDSLRREYANLKTGWGGFSGYDRWFAQDLTNAHLASVSAYHALVPAFERRLAAHGGDLRRFYSDVRALASLPTESRRQALDDPPGAMARAVR